MESKHYADLFASLEEVWEVGYDTGKHVVSWLDLPELGDLIKKSVDWVGLGDRVTRENIHDYVVILAHAAEENARQYTPFEVIASELNKYDNSDETWIAYEDGIARGIEDAVTKRLATWLD